MTAIEGLYGESIVGGVKKRYKKFFTSKDYSPWLYEENEGMLGALQMPLHAVNTSGIADWLNRADVREILNIPTEAPAWQQCADNYPYTKQANASLWIYPILRGKYRILIYSGTTDGAVPTRGTK